jgi:pilus assembly protein FimV
MNRLLPLSLAVALALGSTSALALGLGGINVKSELNAPLKAEIPVYVSSPAEAESLRVELAAAAEFARVGLDIEDVGVPLQFEVGKNARGEPVIIVQSSQPIREPTLTFLVEVNWSNGRFLREYSLLLEPPVTVPVSMPSAPRPAATEPAVQPIAEPEAAAPTPISEPEPLPEPPVAETPAAEPAAPAEAESAPAAPEPEAAPSEPLASEDPVAPEPEPAPVASSAAASEYGPIASGETLWEIANTTRPANITPSQMMIALLRANPDAFYRDNVNALKRGAILRIPGEADLQALAAAEAAAEIVSQNQAWIESTRPTTVADASVESTRNAMASSSASSTPSSRLELVPPAGGQSTADRPGAPGGTGDSAAVRAELARTKEALSSAQQESGELRSRVKELETINSTNQRLLTLKDSELKSLQDKLKAAEVAAAQKPADAAVDSTPVAPVEAPVEPVAATAEPVADAALTPPDAAATETPPTDVAATDPLASAEPAPADADAQTAEVTPIADAEPVAVGEPAPAAAEPWYGMLMNKYVLGGLGLLVLGGLGFALSRRRKQDIPAVEPGSISGQFGDTVGGESEESSLLAALAQDPTDLNAHLNVLEYYYMRRNADKFEAAAEAMYAQLPDPNAPEWQGALLMGRDLCPTHPMFSDGSEPASSGQAFADPFASVPKFEGHEPKAQAAVQQDDDFDFDLDAVPPANPAPAAPPSVPAAAADSFDFNLIDDAAKPAPAAPKQDLSFDFDLDTKSAPAKADEISFELPSIDLGVDMKAPSIEPPALESATQQMPAIKDDFLGDDAVATKIDLARAYLDMGDADGARSMLEEVVNEGSESQKAEARKLLSEIR